MIKLILARINLYLWRGCLDCATYHFNKREEYLERAKALDGYTPMMKLADRYHAIWCYFALWFGEKSHEIDNKLIPSANK